MFQTLSGTNTVNEVELDAIFYNKNTQMAYDVASKQFRNNFTI